MQQFTHKNESDYETLRNEALVMSGKETSVSLFLQHGLAAWFVTACKKPSALLPNKHVITNNKQSELIHVLANMITHH